MTAVGRFTLVPSLSGFSMFETPGNADNVPSVLSFVRNDQARGDTKDEAGDEFAENSRTGRLRNAAMDSCSSTIECEVVKRFNSSA